MIDIRETFPFAESNNIIYFLNHNNIVYYLDLEIDFELIKLTNLDLLIKSFDQI